MQQTAKIKKLKDIIAKKKTVLFKIGVMKLYGVILRMVEKFLIGLKKEKKVDNAKFVKTLLDKKDMTVVKDMIADGVLTSSAVDDMFETGTIQGKQAYALQMFLDKQKVMRGEKQKPSAKTVSNTRRKWAAKYGLMKKKKTQTINEPKFKPYFTK